MATQLDWTKPLCTKHEPPHVAEYLGTCPIHPDRHRAMFVCPSTLPMGAQNYKTGVFRYNLAGLSRGDEAGSAVDLVNYEPSDGARRIAIPGGR